ncbi:MAG: hypothetical protein ACKVQJ_09705 [Pyrinomonadaceae bacterium]
MDLFKYIEDMSSFIEDRNWDGLEASNRTIAESLAGKERIDAIAMADLSDYHRVLCKGLAFALNKATEVGARAVYFEYDLDNNWQSHFFICEDYISKANVQGPGDDDWACEWIDEIAGEGCSLFGQFYESEFDANPMAAGVNLYLIARTVAAFGRCCDSYSDEKVAICIACHDQDPIMRIHEPTDRAGVSL